MHSTQPEQQQATRDVPDWTTHQAEICCPMCEYNLRGLTEPRCPECGYRFEWKVLTDAKTQSHPYLFEHHPERNFRSFWQTAWGGLKPWRFWRELHAGQASKPRRLVIYWFAAMFVASLAVLVPFAIGCIHLGMQINGFRSAYTAGQTKALLANPAFQQMLDRELPLPPSAAFFRAYFSGEAGQQTLLLASVLAVYMAWPWLTFVALMIFRISMRRAKIRSIHVLRCLLYSWDAALWVGLASSILFLAGTFLLDWFRPPQAVRNLRVLSRAFPPAGLSSRNLFDYANEVLLGLLLFSILRLCIAYRKYLRFDWPTATVIASQVILVLLLLIAALWIDTDLTTYWLRMLGLRLGSRYYWWM